MHLLIAALLAWNGWHTSAIEHDRGYPVFAVDGKPFFVYGAAFFYERVPRDRWLASLTAYKNLGINTIDIYTIWNWHEPVEGAPDFSGTTDPRRDLIGLLKLTHQLGFKIILRPGPVIRNEWRNGGYPDWLLRRPEYNMPLHDILEGRYPATATYQNAHANAASQEWLDNATHLHYASQWLRDVLTAVAPYSPDIIAIALDDDQGAYIDNDTYPAPSWHAYIAWLRSQVRGVTGPRVPLFINTFETKVPAAAPAWAWGNWYQSDAYSIGAHDLAEIDFATGLLQTQINVPLMQAEFQAGWLQGADEGAPRPADPTNTALALHELLRDGMHGIVNFPVQDTVYPDGWEAPWANWDYFWDAAYTDDLHRSQRFAPTADFGAIVRRYGTLLARTHPVFDAAIIWPGGLYQPDKLTNRDFAAFADATLAMQRDCRARQLNCALIDPGHADAATLHRYANTIVPIVPNQRLGQITTLAADNALYGLERDGIMVRSLSEVRPLLDAPATTLLISDDETFAFIDSVNPELQSRRVGPFHVKLAHRTVAVPGFTVGARSVRLVPVGVPSAASSSNDGVVARDSFASEKQGRDSEQFGSLRLWMRYGASAGARIWFLSSKDVAKGENVASSIGLLRDAVDPEPSPSARDYIAAYTHPLPAGTFNRPYHCETQAHSIACTYDAPDIPTGGALFERTIAQSPDGNEIVVYERFTPHESTSTARLQSISGFAFADGDALVGTPGTPGVGVLHDGRFTMLRWQPGQVASVQTRLTRGAAIVSLTFAVREVELRLGIAPAKDAAEAEGLLRANPAPSP